MAIKASIASGAIEENNEAILENEPLEAIFALNLGDFLTEHLISDDLLSKINTSVQDKITRLKNQLKELISIYSLDKTLTLLGFDSDEDFVIYNSIAKTMAQMLEADACHVYLNENYVKGGFGLSDFDLSLMGTSLKDLTSKQMKEIGFSLFEDKESPQMRAFLKKETIFLKNVKKSKSWNPLEELNQNEVKTLLVVPMANNSQNIGVLCLEFYNQKELAPEYIELLEITSRLFVTSMRLQELIEEAELLLEDSNATPAELRHLRTELTASIGDLGDEQQMFVETLALAVDAKCDYTREHSQKVAELARKISENIKLNEKTTDLIYYAALLKNIGRITLPEELFNTKGKLSNDDWDKLQNHPNVGVSLLMKVNFMSEVVPYVHYHMERWNGQGKPEGLAGLSIPLGSRIVAVADAYQAMISKRAHREEIAVNDALEIMKQEAGIKWDPVVVEALAAVV
ncbi:MAG: HD domain-containing phosphohydrolase [bacterium]